MPPPLRVRARVTQLPSVFRISVATTSPLRHTPRPGVGTTRRRAPRRVRRDALRSATDVSSTMITQRLRTLHLRELDERLTTFFTRSARQN
ncbi:MAG: hypothetical protein ACRDSF_10680 [Pseudonocardiaceae bacterium]